MQYRDTDSDWETMAKHHPYYAVITNPRFDGTSLSPEIKEEFFSSGQQHVQGVLTMIRTHFEPAFKPQRVMDFGCGVGRVLLPFAAESGSAIGVDVSETMLGLARQNADEKGVRNVQFVLSDDQLSELRDGYDLLHSVIVFQHIPPPRGYILIGKLLQKLQSRGYFYLHFTFAKDRRFLDNALRHVQVYRSEEASISILRETPAEGVGLMSMYDYDLNQLFLTLMTCGTDSMVTHFTDHGGCYGVITCGRKR